MVEIRGLVFMKGIDRLRMSRIQESRGAKVRRRIGLMVRDLGVRN
jgi:hypothetical protein